MDGCLGSCVKTVWITIELSLSRYVATVVPISRLTDDAKEVSKKAIPVEYGLKAAIFAKLMRQTSFIGMQN